MRRFESLEAELDWNDIEKVFSCYLYLDKELENGLSNYDLGTHFAAYNLLMRMTLPQKWNIYQHLKEELRKEYYDRFLVKNG